MSMKRMTSRIALTALAALALAGASCASQEKPRDRERKVRRYDGPVIDLAASLVFTGATDEAEGFRKNAADPRVQKIGAAVSAPAGKPDETRALNDRVIALARDNKKVLPIPSVHPYDGQFAVDELTRMADAGALLVHLSPAPQGLDVADPRLGAVVQRAAERNVAVIVEGAGPADATLFSRVVTLAVRYPTTQIIVARMGVASFRDAAALIHAAKLPGWNDNVWLDLSSTATLYAGSPAAAELLWLVRKMQRRVLFGSGFPLDTSAQAIDTVQNLGLEEGEQADVLYANASRLLKLSN